MPQRQLRLCIDPLASRIPGVRVSPRPSRVVGSALANEVVVVRRLVQENGPMRPKLDHSVHGSSLPRASAPLGALRWPPRSRADFWIIEGSSWPQKEQRGLEG